MKREWCIVALLLCLAAVLSQCSASRSLRVLRERSNVPQQEGALQPRFDDSTGEHAEDESLPTDSTDKEDDEDDDEDDEDDEHEHGAHHNDASATVVTNNNKLDQDIHIGGSDEDVKHPNEVPAYNFNSTHDEHDNEHEEHEHEQHGEEEHAQQEQEQGQEHGHEEHEEHEHEHEQEAEHEHENEHGHEPEHNEHEHQHDEHEHEHEHDEHEHEHEHEHEDGRTELSPSEHYHGEDDYKNDLSVHEISQFIDTQNEARKAEGLPLLQWKPELQKFAQDWVNQLQRHHNCVMKHSSAEDYGENMAWFAGDTGDPERAVDEWLNERHFYQQDGPRECMREDAGDRTCGHYTQVMWRDTKFVGCGIATCGHAAVYSCNYEPIGNWPGETPY